MPIADAMRDNLTAGFIDDEIARELIALLSSGGDARIVLSPETGLNKYLSAPYPRDVTAYASSTANDISAPAFEFLREQGIPDGYGAALNDVRARIRAAYDLNDDVGIVFAPSGTDLEYIALYLAGARSQSGVHNILLGADEVGSGCIHSAHGRYFANETALGVAVKPAQPVGGLGEVSLADIPLRCIMGQVQTSAQICEQVAIEMGVAALDGRQTLLHVVHGSKTGLILPTLSDIDRLRAENAGRLSLVIDACQARITNRAVSDYLTRDAIVFLTGSKFMGGPPFNGFALVPPRLMQSAPQLPSGFSRIFRKAEWPAGWAGSEALEDSPNFGVALRLSASIFELERFSAVDPAKVSDIIAAFRRAVFSHIIDPMGLAMVEPFPPGECAEMVEHPIEMQSLITVDVSSLPNMRTFDDAQIVHRAMASQGLRLGQPVKSVRVAGEWAGTLRIGLSMPQVSAWAEMDATELDAVLTADMTSVAEALKKHSH
ncbi:MAG: hypothetical protein ABJP34_08335 [Erythrobacter sp.]